MNFVLWKFPHECKEEETEDKKLHIDCQKPCLNHALKDAICVLSYSVTMPAYLLLRIHVVVDIQQVTPPVSTAVTHFEFSK